MLGRSRLLACLTVALCAAMLSSSAAVADPEVKITEDIYEVRPFSKQTTVSQEKVLAFKAGTVVRQYVIDKGFAEGAPIGG